LGTRPRCRAPARLDPIPKPGGGVRSLARLEPADLRDYRRLVGAFVPSIESGLSPAAFANRALGRGTGAWTLLEPWRPARAAFRARLRRLERMGAWGRIDVKDCFGSIEAPALERALRRLGAARREIRDLLQLLEGLRIRGLPVGPAPSAILANAVLAAADEALEAAGVRSLRWVDDMVVAGRDIDGVKRGLDVAREALAGVGLVANEGKTVFGDGTPSDAVRLSPTTAVRLSPTRAGALP